MQEHPSVIDDIQCEVLYKKKNKITYCIGNVAVDNYIFVNETQKNAITNALSYMDGIRSLDEIQEILESEHGTKMNMQSLYNLCAENGFIKGVDKNPTLSRRGFNELDLFMVNLFSINIDKFRNFFAFLAKYLHTIVLFMIAISIGLGCLMFVGHAGLNTNIAWYTLLSDPTTIIFYILISTISVILHELSHVVVAYRYSITPKNLTVALYAYITPMFYVRLNGIYMIKPIKRVFVWIAGSTVNFFLAFVCYTLANFTSGLLNLFFLTGVVCNLLLGIYSLLPIYISDGYYILSTILKTPNLRKSSFSQTFNLLKGDFNKEGLIYAVYCFLFVGIIVYFLSGRIYDLVVLVIQGYENGLNIFQIMESYITIIIFVCIGIGSRIITALMRKKSALKNDNNLKGIK